MQTLGGEGVGNSHSSGSAVCAVRNLKRSIGGVGGWGIRIVRMGSCTILSDLCFLEIIH